MADTLASRKIVVGMQGDGYTNLQCLAALGDQGFHAVFSRKKGLCVVSLFQGSDLKKTGEGPTYSVALRRLFTDCAKLRPEIFTEERA